MNFAEWVVVLRRQVEEYIAETEKQNRGAKGIEEMPEGEWWEHFVWHMED